eukprot:CAMPEP_0170519238 /NCGR_PEP_ID=MMETSP0209-20121228/4733_1 /TAXON_ID=665100 ORGANISM="Litonotus pictus, Strain P1" /NCGR_SAMPLE_ID=MMETSP0209 /ASSEMBLY_ACC=CAM_ASM_000301 /LENGTH=292 /DNA_ID=CAMNT_0010805079 /DNA_START=1833 /DNA_END=2711 /DNA_ORIENTATION=-
MTELTEKNKEILLESSTKSIGKEVKRQSKNTQEKGKENKDNEANDKAKKDTEENTEKEPTKLFELKKQKITCIRFFEFLGTKFFVSGANDGSICFFNSKTFENTYYLEPKEKNQESAIKQIIRFTHGKGKKEYIIYLIEKAGTLIIKDLGNNLIKTYNNDRDILFLDRLSDKYFFYVEKESNKLSLISTKKIIKRLRTFQQIALKYDPFLTKYIQDGETIFAFGYDYSDGEPLQGKGIDFIKLKKKTKKNQLGDEFSSDSESSHTENESESERSGDQEDSDYSLSDGSFNSD